MWPREESAKMVRRAEMGSIQAKGESTDFNSVAHLLELMHLLSIERKKPKSI